MIKLTVVFLTLAVAGLSYSAPIGSLSRTADVLESSETNAVISEAVSRSGLLLGSETYGYEMGDAENWGSDALWERERFILHTYMNVTNPAIANMAVHPDIYVFDHKWNGYTHWIIYTPFPYLDVANALDYENPCIEASNDGINWEVPAGLTNPIEQKPALGTYSDPELVFFGDKLYAVYRHSYDTDDDILYWQSSSDGVNWSTKTVLLTGGTKTLLSPTLVPYSAGKWRLYNVDENGADNVIQYRESTDFRDSTSWSSPVTCSLLNQNTATGLTPWHIKIRKFRNQWVMLMASILSAVPDGGKLYCVVGEDGGHTFDFSKSLDVLSGWTPDVGGGIGKDGNVYRSTFWPMWVDGKLCFKTWCLPFGTEDTGFVCNVYPGYSPIGAAQQSAFVYHSDARSGARYALGYDSFNRTNDTSVGDADLGGAWTTTLGSGFGITSNVLTHDTTSNAQLTLANPQSAETNAVVTFKIESTSSSYLDVGDFKRVVALLGYADSNSCFLGGYGSAGNWEIRIVRGGAFVETVQYLGSYPKVGDIFQFSLIDSLLELKVNDVKILEFDATAYPPAGLKYGIRCDGEYSIDNFSVCIPEN